MIGHEVDDGFSSAHEPSPKSVLGKARLILEAFQADESQLSLTQITERTGVAKATTYRLCQELVSCGLIEREGSNYRLGLRLFEIGLRAPRQRSLREVAKPILEDLAHCANNPVNLAVPDATDLLCIESIGAHRNHARSSGGGMHMPLHRTAAGKLTLAYLPGRYSVDTVVRSMADRHTRRTITTLPRLHAELAQIREHGYATEFGETRDGYMALAVPVFDQTGTLVAALSVVAAISGSKVSRLLSFLIPAAQRITTAFVQHEAMRIVP